MNIHYLRTEINGHHSYRIITIHEGQLVGTLELYDLQTDYPYLGSIYVHPDYRRQGVTTAMLKRALDLVEQTGAQVVSLVVRNDNEPATRCYEADEFRHYQDMPGILGFSQWAFWFVQ